MLGHERPIDHLARRLRERDFTVFYSEDEAAPGDQLDETLKRALHRSRILVVVANRGTLADPRWVRVEVEEFKRVHPEQAVMLVAAACRLVTRNLTRREWQRELGDAPYARTCTALPEPAPDTLEWEQ